MALTVIHPLLVGLLITYFIPGSGVTQTQAYLYAAALSAITLSLTNSDQWFFFATARYGIKAGVLLSSVVFQKVFSGCFTITMYYFT